MPERPNVLVERADVTQGAATFTIGRAMEKMGQAAASRQN
jgi:hypothetical protein